MKTIDSKPAKVAPTVPLNGSMSARTIKDRRAAPAQQRDAAPTVARARSMGAETASEWLSNDTYIQESLTLPAWRAEMHADFVGAYKTRAGFMQLLTAWEQGFDSTVNAFSPRVTAPDAIHEPASVAPGAPVDSKTALKSLCDSVSDDAENILCATSVMRDLLRLAIQEVERTSGTRADAAIRAAERYVGDIEKIVEHLNALEQAAQEGVAA